MACETRVTKAISVRPDDVLALLDGAELFGGELEPDSAATCAEGVVVGVALGKVEARGCAVDEVSDGLLRGEDADAAVGSVEAGRRELHHPLTSASNEEAEVDTVRHEEIVEGEAG
jgi:hypothetical protein